MTLNPLAYQNEHYNAPILLHLGMYISLLAHLLVTGTIWYDYHQNATTRAYIVRVSGPSVDDRSRLVRSSY